MKCNVDILFVDNRCFRTKKEDKLYFSITVLISLILLITFDNLEVFSTNMFFGIPLLISYLSKRDRLSIFISIVLMLLFNNIYNISFYFSLIKYQ